MLAAFLVLCCVYVCYNVGCVPGIMLCSAMASCWLSLARMLSLFLNTDLLLLSY